MTQERFARQMREIVSGDDAFAVIDAAATLTLYQQQVRADTTDGAMAITLPSVAEAKGLLFSIILETDNGDLTVQDQDDSYDWSDMVLTAIKDRVLLYSDGFVWHKLIDITT
jgi:hypothetical protein